MISGYHLVLASSVGDRDGMALELTRADSERVAEVFEDEATGRRTVRTFGDQDVPLAVMEWFLEEAKKRL